jgi:hypothetical protein
MPGQPEFAQDGSLDVMPPSVKLVQVLDRVSGPARSCDGLSDDELTGVLGRWAAAESWASSAKLQVVVELVRRRGIDGMGIRGGWVPAGWDDTVTEETAAALAMSKPAAQGLVDVAVSLATRLDDAAASNAEKLALMWAGGSFAGKTPGEIHKLMERASVAGDPEAAENRRKGAEQCARVETWREPTGTIWIS